MVETDYDKYIMREPLAVGRYSPILHVCGEKHRFGSGECPGSKFSDFPAEQTLMYITEPFLMNTPTHAHDYDQLLYILGGNPANFYDFDAEIEITLGEKSKIYLVNETSIVFIPKGMMHCPINFKRVDKPFIFGHLCFAPTYTRSSGNMTAHPRAYETYSGDEIARLKTGARSV
jgi:mannose-6-phosphate isomerase-like protein (cupin superfamily)